MTDSGTIGAIWNSFSVGMAAHGGPAHNGIVSVGACFVRSGDTDCERFGSTSFGWDILTSSDDALLEGGLRTQQSTGVVPR